MATWVASGNVCAGREQTRTEGAGHGDRGLLNLIKGGLRTITGLIGKRNQHDYQLKTSVATIGIRGTEYSVVYGNSITVSIGEGAVEVCNGGGCLIGATGQTLYVNSATSQPVIVERKVELQPPPALQRSPTFSSVDNRGADGRLSGLGASSTAGLATVPLPNGTGQLSAASMSTTGSYSAGLLGGTLSFGSGGELSQFVDCCSPSTANYSGAVVAESGSDGIIAWGRWSGGVRGSSDSLVDMNYIAAVNANAVTATSIVRGYASFASTAPVITSGGSVVAIGASNAVTGSLTVNFTNLSSGGSLTYLLNIPVAGQTFTINGSANQYSGTGFLGSSSTITSSGAGCTPSCSGVIPWGDAIQGFFTGASAQRAGASYGFVSQLGKVNGAVVFK